MTVGLLVASFLNSSSPPGLLNALRCFLTVIKLGRHEYFLQGAVLVIWRFIRSTL